ncbi:hypothetical protein A2U01_0115238, partial [Trifolium medium]|nr:hypothetical protein [Trifolium medium]
GTVSYSSNMMEIMAANVKEVLTVGGKEEVRSRTAVF